MLLLRAPFSAAQTPAGQRALYELEVNGQRGEDVMVWLNGDDVLVPEAALRRAGILRLRGSKLKLEGVDYVSLQNSAPRLRYQVDSADLTLSITAPPDALASTRLDLSGQKPPGIWYSDDFSMYLNYAPSWFDFTRVRGFAEAGMNAGSFRVTTSESYDQNSGAVRLLSQAAFSDRKRLREYSLGDSYTSTGSLGGSALLLGFSIARRFELDPYLVRVPTLGYSGSVIAPSTVDVYVNDVLVRRVEVAPGDFQLLGVAPTSGSGSVRYVIRDAMGGQSEVRSRYYSGSTALARGLSDYVYSVGFLRRDYGLRSFSYGDPVLLTRYRRGLDGTLTLGGRAELSPAHVSAGSELVVAGRFGEFELGTGFSIDRSEGVLERGSAGLLAYSYRVGRASLRSAFKATSARYTTVGLSANANRNLFEHSTASSFSLSARLSLTALVGLGWARDTGASAQGSLLLGAQLARGLWLQLRAQRTDTQSLPSEYSAYAALNIALPLDHSASISETISSHSPETVASVARPMLGMTGVGYQLSATLGETRRHVGNVQAQTPYFRASASSFNENGRWTNIIEGAGTVAFMPRAGIFFSRPVTQSFAVVEVPDTPGIDTYVNNHLVGRTSESGKVFVPDLLSYYANRIRAEAPEMGIESTLDEDEVLVAPPTRGGAHVVFEPRSLHLLRGVIAPLGLALDAIRYGELTLSVEGKTWSSPIGVNGEFELDSVPAGEWPVLVQGAEASCHFWLLVPRRGAPIEDVGAQSCMSTSGVTP
ncbi:MAG: fimbria/pilus outer membrane usher protein [Polyangiaceae bacterium]